MKDHYWPSRSREKCREYELRYLAKLSPALREARRIHRLRYEARRRARPEVRRAYLFHLAAMSEWERLISPIKKLLRGTVTSKRKIRCAECILLAIPPRASDCSGCQNLYCHLYRRRKYGPVKHKKRLCVIESGESRKQFLARWQREYRKTPRWKKWARAYRSKGKGAFGSRSLYGYKTRYKTFYEAAMLNRKLFAELTKDPAHTKLKRRLRYEERKADIK